MSETVYDQHVQFYLDVVDRSAALPGSRSRICRSC